LPNPKMVSSSAAWRVMAEIVQTIYRLLRSFKGLQLKYLALPPDICWSIPLFY